MSLCNTPFSTSMCQCVLYSNLEHFYQEQVSFGVGQNKTYVVQMGEMLTMTHLETKVHPNQPFVHRNFDQRGGWQFSSKGEGGVQEPVLFFPCKDPVYLWNFSRKHWQAAQACAGQGSSLADGVGQKAQLMDVISGEQVNGNS